MGPKKTSYRKKDTKFRLRQSIENCKTIPKGPFFSLFHMTKPFFKGQKWLLIPYFPLNGGLFVLWKRPLSLSTVAFSSLSDRALLVPEKTVRPLFKTSIPGISGKYGLRNYFCPLKSGFLVRKSEERAFS